ncbi:hypothetical protein DFP72DRAFT_872061, partial [Ephemerocybe angulata]
SKSWWPHAALQVRLLEGCTPTKTLVFWCVTLVLPAGLIVLLNRGSISKVFYLQDIYRCLRSLSSRRLSTAIEHATVGWDERRWSPMFWTPAGDLRYDTTDVSRRPHQVRRSMEEATFALLRLSAHSQSDISIVERHRALRLGAGHCESNYARFP